MKRVIFVLGDKGGTGKSVVARYLWDRLRGRGDAKAFDADGQVGQLAQFYAVRSAAGSLVEPQPASGVEPILLHAEERGERDQGVYRIVECTAEVVLVDCPATSLTVFERLQADWSFFDDLQNHGFEPIMVNVVTPYRASLANVARTLALVPHAKNVVVFNTAFGRRSDFRLWDGTEQKPSRGKVLLTERGGVEVVMPALNAGSAAMIDAENVTFSGAVSGDGDLMSFDRQYTANWLRACDAAFEPVAETLGLAADLISVSA